MGYCMSLRESDFRIKEENLQKCFEVIRGLHTQSNLWIDSDGLKNVKTIEEAFEEWGWEVTQETGDVRR